MKRVAEEGISKGEITNALNTFIAYAEGLNEIISTTSSEIRDSIRGYLEEIDTQDQYLY